MISETDCQLVEKSKWKQEVVAFPQVESIVQNDFAESPEALSKAAAEQLNETTESRCQCLKEVSEWLRQQPFFNRDIHDQETVVKFLRQAKYRVERAKYKLTMYYELPTEFPGIFGGKLDPTSSDLLKYRKVYCVMPRRDPKTGSAVVMYRPGRFDCDTDDPNHLFTFITMSVELLLTFPSVQVHGLQIVVDHTDMSLRHLRTIGLHRLRQIPRIMFGAFPVRLVAIHHFNETVVFHTFFAIIKPLLPTKVAARFTCHGQGTDHLGKHFNIDLLPNEYGGQAGPLADLQDNWTSMFNTHCDYLRHRFA